MKDKNELVSAGLSVALALGLAGVAQAAISMFPERVANRTGELLIGIDGFKPNAGTERHVKAMKEAGFDMIESGVDNIDVATLDLFQKYGIGCYIGGGLPSWWGGSKDCRGGTMEAKRPFKVWDEPLAKFAHHPAIWGLEIGDEPSGLDFPYYGKLLAYLRSKRPDLAYYVCLFPCYAMPGTAGKDPAETQLGSPNYTKYIADWCKYVDVDYIATDIYPWGWSVTRSQMFENMRIIADAAQASGRTWNAVLQGNKFYEDYGEGNIGQGRSMTDNTMRFQANAALAYGADHLWWGCWALGWWTENVVRPDGSIDEVVLNRYKRINAEYKTLGREYVKFRRLSTELVGFKGTSLDDGKILQPFVSAANSAAFSDVEAEDGAALAVGHMAARDGSGKYAMFVAACDDPEDEHNARHVIRFRVPFGRKATAFGAKGPKKLQDDGKGNCAIGLKSNEAALVVAD